jgi:hypothetical protein
MQFFPESNKRKNEVKNDQHMFLRQNYFFLVLNKTYIFYSYIYAAPSGNKWHVLGVLNKPVFGGILLFTLAE